MPFLTIAGTRIHYEDTGPGSTGEVVLFSHGLLFDLELFRAQIEHLRSRYRVVAWDHRGQGGSDDDPRRVIGMELLTDDALALMKALDVQSAHFVGLSMGGFVGMRLAARWPERVRSLVLMNTSAEIEPAKNAPKYRALAAIAELLGPTAVLGRVAPIMFGRTTMTDPSRAGLLTDYRERATRTRRTIARAVRGVTDREDVLHLLAAIVAPTTILAGEEDVATPPEKSHRIHAGIPGSRLVLVPRAGHSSAIEAPEAVCSALDAHLARVRSGAAG